jgi:hypothetical protein
MMKKITVALAVASVAATATVALAGPNAGTGINGSWHDINSAGGGYVADSLGRTCVFCHTPHNAIAADNLVPLWNHAQTQLPTMQPYAWVSPMNKIKIASDPLVGPSRLCMACHDGSTAVDSHGSAASDNGGNTPMTAHYTDALKNTAKRYITDLTVTHPIGFLYDDAVKARNVGQDKAEIITKDHGFIKDASGITGVNANWDTTMDSASRNTAGYTSKKIQDTLYGGFMTCATCHDVHNSVNAKPTGQYGNYNYFLYAQEEGSAICLSCHVK